MDRMELGISVSRSSSLVGERVARAVKYRVCRPWVGIVEQPEVAAGTRPPSKGSVAYSGAGHVADHFRDLEEVSDVSCVQEGDVAAWLDASSAYLVEHASKAFSGVDRANENPSARASSRIAA
jgi:hypothetical protein